MRSFLRSFVFSFSRGILIFFFFHLRIFVVCPLPIFTSIRTFTFFPSVLIFSWILSSILSVIVLFRFSLFALHIFLCQIPSLYIDWISSQQILRFPIFFYLANYLKSPIFMRELFFFSCDLWNLYLLVHFQNMWLSGIIAITNSKCDCEFSWKTPLYIFTLVKLFPFSVSLTL